MTSKFYCIDGNSDDGMEKIQDWAVVSLALAYTASGTKSRDAISIEELIAEMMAIVTDKPRTVGQKSRGKVDGRSPTDVVFLVVNRCNQIFLDSGFEMDE